MEQREYKVVGKSFRKKDSMQLLLGKPVYMDDVTPDALVVKILRSPHANAIIQEINTKAARLVPGVVDIYTWEVELVFEPVWDKSRMSEEALVELGLDED